MRNDNHATDSLIAEASYGLLQLAAGPSIASPAGSLPEASKITGEVANGGSKVDAESQSDSYSDDDDSQGDDSTPAYSSLASGYPPLASAPTSAGRNASRSRRLRPPPSSPPKSSTYSSTSSRRAPSRELSAGPSESESEDDLDNLPEGTLPPVERSGRLYCPLPQCARSSGFLSIDKYKTHTKRSITHNAGPVAEGSGQFRCTEPGCHKSYSRRDTLKDHQETHKTRFPCPKEGCGQSFAWYKSLRKHIQDHDLMLGRFSEA